MHWCQCVTLPLYAPTAGEGSEVKVTASGPQTVQFVNKGYGKHAATLAAAGSYVLTATFGGKLASGEQSSCLIESTAGMQICMPLSADRTRLTVQA